MSTKKKVLIIILLLILSPLIVGIFIPKTKVIKEVVVIDKMYYYIVSDIANHYEEAAWRSNIDTLLPHAPIDGQEAWVEYYNGGDSVLWMVQRLSETDYIRIIHRPDGVQLMRNITLADINGMKTGVRYIEETYEKNPLKRFAMLFSNKQKDRARQYLNDLAEKHKPDPNAPEDDGMGW